MLLCEEDIVQIFVPTRCRYMQRQSCVAELCRRAVPTYCIDNFLQNHARDFAGSSGSYNSIWVFERALEAHRTSDFCCDRWKGESVAAYMP